MNKEDMLTLLKHEVVPALGCTEPVCVAVAAADAAHAVGGRIQKIALSVSRNIYKNGMFVGIPGFERIGLKYAAALGAYIAQPDAGLEIMKALDEDIAAAAVDLVDKEAVSIDIAENESGVYVKCSVWTSEGQGVSVIRKDHTNIVLTTVNEQIIFQKEQGTDAADPTLIDKLRTLTITEMRALAASATEEELAFLWDGVEMNQALADYGVSQKAGIGISDVFARSLGGDLLGSGLLQQMLLGVASAIEARLDGCPNATMSSAGSGSKGIAVILPVAYAAKAVGADHLRTLQALAFAHMVNSYLNSHIGKLSAICSCATASATAASAAMTWLFGGSDEQISWAIRNMTGTVTGMICDGGKVGCALKLSSATTAGLLSAILAVNQIVLRARDGICAETPEKCADNMGRISNPGMLETDKEILQIMLEKAQQHNA